MKGKQQDNRVSRSLFSIKQYFIFFFLIAAVVTFSFLLFWRYADVEIRDIRRSALVTFGNVLFLSLLCSIIDGLRRKYTVERPVKRIIHATKQITQGDFSARIQPFHRVDRRSEFDVIIEDFNKMAEELASLETLRTDFIASVSHEIKTPLAVIQNYATMLQTPGLPEEVRQEHGKSIAAASRRLSELITNILKLNSLENQQIFPAKTEYDLGEQLLECLLDFEDLWESKSLAIQTDIQPMRIQADAALLSLVWNNLYSNAFKFTPEGGTVGISLRSDNGRAVVQISDTGCGMAQEVGARIFDKFYQGDPSHATQGNGLGLSLVKRVVDIVQGKISVESTLGQGSIFTVEIGSDEAGKG